MVENEPVQLSSRGCDAASSQQTTAPIPNFTHQPASHSINSNCSWLRDTQTGEKRCICQINEILESISSAQLSYSQVRENRIISEEVTAAMKHRHGWALLGRAHQVPWVQMGAPIHISCRTSHHCAQTCSLSITPQQSSADLLRTEPGA